MLTTEKFDETSNEENNVALSGTPEDTMSSNVEETEKRVLRKRKKTTQEFVCKFEDFAHTIGKSTNSSGEGIKKKLHYSKFEFHSIQYGLEDYVVLLAEDTYDNNHVAIIKDIYVQGNKLGHVYLDVQWFYRPKDVHKSYLKDWKQRDSRELFASFHRDEKVSAESVMNGCDVYFLTKYINVPNREEHSSYVVQHAYNHLTSKMWSFADVNNGYFLDEEEREIRRLISKTSSLLGLDFHHDDDDEDDDDEDIVESSNAQEMLIIEKELAAADERVVVVKRSNVANEPYYKSILDKFGVLTGDSVRDYRLVKLVEAVGSKFGFTHEEKLVSDVVDAVCDLEKVIFDYGENDMTKYTDKVYVLVDKFKKSRMLGECLLNGKLTPQQIVTMNFIEKEKKIVSRRKQSVPNRWLVREAERVCNVADEQNYKSMLSRFDVLTGDPDRDNRLVELVDAVKNTCRVTTEKLATDHDDDDATFWLNDVLFVMCGLERAFFDFVDKDIPKYNDKVQVLVGKLKDSQILVKRILGGNLTPKKIVKMDANELTKSLTYGEMTTVLFGIPNMKQSKKVWRKTFFKG